MPRSLLGEAGARRGLHARKPVAEGCNPRAFSGHHRPSLRPGQRACKGKILLCLSEVRLDSQGGFVMRDSRLIFTRPAKEVPQLFVGDLEERVQNDAMFVPATRLGPETLSQKNTGQV